MLSHNIRRNWNTIALHNQGTRVRADDVQKFDINKIFGCVPRWERRTGLFKIVRLFNI